MMRTPGTRRRSRPAGEPPLTPPSGRHTPSPSSSRSDTLRDHNPRAAHNKPGLPDLNVIRPSAGTRRALHIDPRHGTARTGRVATWGGG
jgi:hypothetical protein